MFELEGELKEIQEWAREFARREIAPRALELDRKPRDHFDWEVVRAGARAGLLTQAVPEALGGTAPGEDITKSLLPAALVIEELAYACAGVACIFGAHNLGFLPVFLSLDPALIQRVVSAIAASVEDEHPKLCAFAITEPGAGSDVEDTDGARTARLSCFARREGDDYILDGRKCFISNGSVAHFITVFACTDRKRGLDAWTCFLVERGTPGFSVGRVEEKMGQRACPAAELVFEECRVPAANCVGGEGAGWTLSQLCLNLSRAPVGALAIGIARRAFDIALDYAGQRYQGGKLLLEHQWVRMKLAEMETRISAARALVWRAIEKVQRTMPPPGREAAMAKSFASDVAVSVCTDAMQLLGGYGYLHDYGVEKCLRDARLTQIYEGTNEIQRLRIAEEYSQ